MFLNIFGNLLIFLKRKEVRDMAVIYVALIIKGKRTFESVPDLLKQQVKELLVELDCGQLAEG